MIFSRRNESFESRVQGFSTGLVGTVGVRVLDNAGATTIPRTTAGIIENPAGSGSYAVTLIAPDVDGQFSVFWDTGVISPSTTYSEYLIVSGISVASIITPVTETSGNLASLDDINANLQGDVALADDDNTKLIQITVRRIIKGYLARILTPEILGTWVTPSTTPEIIRVVAGKLIAAQHYFNQISASSIVIEDNNYAQKLYDEAMALLNYVLSGEIAIPNVVEIAVGLTDLDYFPRDTTDRAFTRSMEL